MKLKKIVAGCSLALAAMFGTAAQAQISGDVIKIGIITDMSSVYADIDGQGGVEAIRMAIADAGGSVAGKKVEVLFADHQNKADVAAAKAREWFDTQGLDMLIGGHEVPNRIYRNDSAGGAISLSLAWSSTEINWTTAASLGDYNGDGVLDLATVGIYSPIRLYRNTLELMATEAGWTPSDPEFAMADSVAWGDADGDGDLDLAVGALGFEGEPIRIYRNNQGALSAVAAWSSAQPEVASSLAWGERGPHRSRLPWKSHADYPTPALASASKSGRPLMPCSC